MRQTLDLSDELAAAIDRWRGRRLPLLSRAQAVRQLLETALSLDAADGQLIDHVAFALCGSGNDDDCYCRDHGAVPETGCPFYKPEDARAAIKAALGFSAKNAE